jgi:hypothetical protein
MVDAVDMWWTAGGFFVISFISMWIMISAAGKSEKEQLRTKNARVPFSGCGHPYKHDG